MRALGKEGSQALLLTPWRCGGRKVRQETHSLGVFLGGMEHRVPTPWHCEGQKQEERTG